MVAERSSLGVAGAVLGAVGPEGPRRAGQAVAGHVVTFFADILALALLAAVRTEVVRVALGLAMQSGISGETETLSGGGLARATVDARALVGAIRAPVPFRAPESFATGAGKAWRAGANVGLEAVPVLAGLVADSLADLLLRDPISGAALPPVHEPGHVLLLDGLDQLLLEHWAPGTRIVIEMSSSLSSTFSFSSLSLLQSLSWSWSWSLKLAK